MPKNVLRLTLLRATAGIIVSSVTLIGFAPTLLADDFELSMVIKSTTNPYYNATLKGAQIAAQEIGGSVKNYGPTQSSGQAQVDIINNLADRHARGIAVAPSDPDAVAPAMKRAQRLGSKVITFDADSAAEARTFFVNQATADSVGRFGATLLDNAMGVKGGKVAIVSAQPTAANQNAWIKAFRDEMKKQKGIEIVDEVYGYDNEQKAFDATVALVTKYPDLAGIYAPTCPGLAAVARALESVNKGKGVIKLAGTCVPSITGKYMLDGTVQGFYLWDPVKLGYVTYYAAKYFAEGKIQGKVGDSFTIEKGKWPGKYEINSESQIVTGQPLQYTADNLKDNDY